MHNQGFDRLIMAMDEVAADIDESVIMQVGSASIKPTHAEWFKFADGERMDELIAAARVVVAHAGAGTIITTFRHRKPLVVVPRRRAHNEHIDDHQIDLAQALAAQGKLYFVDEPTLATLLEGISEAERLHLHENNSLRLAAAVSKILTANAAAATEERSQPTRKRKPNISS